MRIPRSPGRGWRRVVSLGVTTVLVVLLVPAPAYAPPSVPVDFPDTHLDTVVRTAIGKPVGQIYASDLETLTALYANGKSIQHLDGLEHATSLTRLDLWSNDITTITPVAALTNLSYLDLLDNNISDLVPLSGLTNLTALYVDSNHITSIAPLGGLTGLTFLSLSGNEIGDISPLSGLTEVGGLYLHGNRVVDVTPLRGMAHLTSLGLQDNEVCDISPLAGLPLTWADVRDNWLDVTPGSPSRVAIGSWPADPGDVFYLPQRSGGVLQGTVYDARGWALPGATVAVLSGPVTTTGADGTYLIRVLPTGLRAVTITAPYYYGYMTAIPVSAGTTYTVMASLTPIELTPSIWRSPNKSSVTYRRRRRVAKVTFSATVTDARGPVPGAQLYLQRSYNRRKWYTLAKLTTDSSGRALKTFRFKKRGTMYIRWRMMRDGRPVKTMWVGLYEQKDVQKVRVK